MLGYPFLEATDKHLGRIRDPNDSSTETLRRGQQIIPVYALLPASEDGYATFRSLIVWDDNLLAVNGRETEEEKSKLIGKERWLVREIEV